MLTVALVIGLGSSGAADNKPEPAALVAAPVQVGVGKPGVKASHPVAACPSARKAVRYYAARVRYWRDKMGAGVGSAAGGRTVLRGNPSGCPRYLAHVLQRKAYAARKAYTRWHAYHYDWRSWMPDKWQRIGACETGYGRRPGNWRHSNSSYEGAFGFAKSSWDSFKYQADPKAGPYPADAWQATPRQQYEVALAIYRRYGFSGWGCRGA